MLTGIWTPKLPTLMQSPRWAAVLEILCEGWTELNTTFQVCFKCFCADWEPNYWALFLVALNVFEFSLILIILLIVVVLLWGSRATEDESLCVGACFHGNRQTLLLASCCLWHKRMEMGCQTCWPCWRHHCLGVLDVKWQLIGVVTYA